MSDPTVEGHPSAGSVIHSTIDPKNFSLGLIAASLQNRKFFQDRHLVDILETVAKSNINTRLKPFQIQTLDTPIPDCQRDDKALHGLLMTWFDIYDSAFFGGGLRDLRDRIELQRHGDKGMETSGVKQRAIAYFQESGLGKIVINADYDKAVGATWEEKFLGSLLHEMLHAFLIFYSCRCHQCDAMAAASLGGVGITQHGPVWINSMVALGTVVQDRINWQLIVTLRQSIALEMKYSNWEPTLQEVIGWGESLALLRLEKKQQQDAEDEIEREEARKLEEARKAQQQTALKVFGLPADATQEQLEEEMARQAGREQEREAAARQIAQARIDQGQKEQMQREQEKARREAEQRALRAFGLPADYLQNQDEQEVARLMAQGIQNQNQKAKVPRRQPSQDANPKKDEVVSLKDQVLRRFWSGVTKKEKKK